MPNTNNNKRHFFSFDKDYSLSIMLFCIILAIPFAGLNSIVSSAALVLIFELVFILSYGLFYRGYPALPLLKKQRPILLYLLLLWLVLMLVSFIRILIDNDTVHLQRIFATGRILTILVHLLFCWSVANYFIMSKIRFDRYWLSICLSVSTLAAFYIVFYFFGPAMDSRKWFINPPFAVHIRHIGSVALVSCVIAMSYVLSSSSNNKAAKVAATIFLITSFAFLWWMGGRTSTFSAVICCICLSLYLLIYKRLSPFNLLTVITCLALAAILANSLSIFHWNGMGRIFETLPATSSTTISTSSSETKSTLDHINTVTTGRLNIWTISLNALNDSIWLGLGPNGYVSIPERPYGVQPHNLFVQFLIEWGLLGGLAFTLLLITGAWFGLKTICTQPKQVSTAQISACMVILSLSILGLTDGSYYHSQPLFYLSLAFAIFPIYAKKKSSRMPT